MLLSPPYQQKTIKNYQNFLAKDLKDHCIGMNIKQKERMKIRQMNIDIFWNQTLWELTDCLFCLILIKMIMLKDSKLEEITYQKALSRIITSSSIEKTLVTN